MNCVVKWYTTEAATTSESVVTVLLTTKTTTSSTLFARLQLPDQPETVLGMYNVCAYF